MVLVAKIKIEGDFKRQVARTNTFHLYTQVPDAGHFLGGFTKDAVMMIKNMVRGVSIRSIFHL